MEIATHRDHLIGIGPLVIGIFVVLMLIGAVVLGLWYRAREPENSSGRRGGAWETRDEYETGSVPENHGPGHQELARFRTDLREQRDPNDVPRDGIRRMPYEFGPRTVPHRVPEGEPAEPEPRTWERGGSGHGTG